MILKLCLFQVRKAYRKKALDCHPDKNPDNPKAAELFHELSKALEILTDEKARSVYDKYQQAKRATQIRNNQLDAKRRKLKDDLEERERQATYNVVEKKFVNVEDQLKAEVDRLRKEGSKLLEEEQRYLREQIFQAKQARINSKRKFILNLDLFSHLYVCTNPSIFISVWEPGKHQIKISWKASKSDPSNGGYSEETLRRFLSKYGDISELIISSTKKGSGLVEFKTREASEMAIAYERGDLNNPLTLKWIGNPPSSQSQQQQILPENVVNNNDFESLVLRQLRQAEERKRLIAQMQNDDEEP